MVQLLMTGTIVSPWPPSTIARTSLTDTPAASARNSWKRAESRMPAMPTTFLAEKPVTFFSS